MHRPPGSVGAGDTPAPSAAASPAAWAVQPIVDALTSVRPSLASSAGLASAEQRPLLEGVTAPVDEPAAQMALYRRLARRATGAPRVGVLFRGNVGLTEALDADCTSSERDALETLALDRLAQLVMGPGSTLAIADVRVQAPDLVPASGRPPVVAFLGVPLCANDPARAGCFYVYDTEAREWTSDQVEAMVDLARLLEGDAAVRADSSERRGLENLVRMLGTAVENMQLGVTVTDPAGKIIYINPAEARMHGFDVGELVGKHARLLGPPELTRMLDTHHVRRTTSWTRETVNVRKDGSRFPVLLWSDLVTDAAGRTIGIVTCSEDITERKRSEQALRDYALRDALTGLPNRVYFLDRLTQAIQRCRHDQGQRFAVLFLDLDRFKVVNDSLGHHVGDELLSVIAQRLQGCLRPTDIVARFGGDEFAILLEEAVGPEDAARVARRVQDSLTAPIQLNGYELFTSASIGIVMSSSAVEQPEYLWRSADMAMYRAKSRGTGQFEIFDRTMHADALARLQLETDLRRAIDRSEFQLHYQPVVDLESSRVVGFEALVRWNHPLRGLVYPSEFIPIAEETGMIVRLGEWVLREGCRQASDWHAVGEGGVPPLWVGINLSSKQLSQPNLLERVKAAVHENGIVPQMLKLEITESGIIENTEAATRTLRDLKSLGVQLFMDDFGTGYSSLSYLHRLPLDALKIDRSFVSQMVRGDRHAQLVQTILQLARSVNLRVVAEGVSTPDQLALLREFGCEFAQGFLFSHPIAADKIAGYLESRSVPIA